MSLTVKDGNATNVTLQTVQQSGEHIVSHTLSGTAVSAPTYAPAHPANTYVQAAIDRTTGALIVMIPDLNRTSDSVTTYPTAVSTASGTSYLSHFIAKQAPGKALAVFGYNSLTTAQFIQLHDGTVLPPNGVSPVAVQAVNGTSNFSFPLSAHGMDFASGIVVTTSTTGPTLTIGAANTFFTVNHV